MEEIKKVYIYRFTTIPELVSIYNGNLTLLEKQGMDSDNHIDVEDFDYVHKDNFDNLDYIINDSFNDGLCYDFFSFRNDRMLDFKLAIYEILQHKINRRKKEIVEFENLQNNLGNLPSEVVEYCVDKYNL